MSVLREAQELRSIAAAFESAQAQRLRTGEQIRALIGNRESAGAREQRADGNRNNGTAHNGGTAHMMEALLARIRAGATFGTAPALADAYRRQWNEERDLLRLLTERIARHPTWPW